MHPRWKLLTSLPECSFPVIHLTLLQPSTRPQNLEWLMWVTVAGVKARDMACPHRHEDRTAPDRRDLARQTTRWLPISLGSRKQTCTGSSMACVPPSSVLKRSSLMLVHDASGPSISGHACLGWVLRRSATSLLRLRLINPSRSLRRISHSFFTRHCRMYRRLSD